MRKINQLKMIKTLLIVLAVALISACNEQEEDQTGDASGLVLPPAASMTMEFEAMPKSQNGLSAEIASLILPRFRWVAGVRFLEFT